MGADHPRRRRTGSATGTIHYMDERERFTERWHGAIRDWPGELSLAWGMQDPVATSSVLDGLRELRPGDAGRRSCRSSAHYPQIEAPAADRLAARRPWPRADGGRPGSPRAPKLGRTPAELKTPAWSGFQNR